MSRLLHLIIFIGVLLTLIGAQAQTKPESSCPIVKIEAERLPDLTISRSGHSIVSVNDEVTVIGGHTTNFGPTPTAEYYKDGKWHLIETAFTHDDGFALPLSSGKVLIAYILPRASPARTHFSASSKPIYGQNAERIPGIRQKSTLN